MTFLYWTFGFSALAGAIYGIWHNWDYSDGSSRIGLISERACKLGIDLGRAGDREACDEIERQVRSGERSEV